MKERLATNNMYNFECVATIEIGSTEDEVIYTHVRFIANVLEDHIIVLN
jgi:hypothetical protein